MAKITGKEGLIFEGTAKVYDGEDAMMEGLANKEITAGMIVVIRYEGPKEDQVCRRCSRPRAPSWVPV